jgi:hypothetical protein
MRRRGGLWMLGAVLALLAAGLAFAAPPPDASGRWENWFRGLVAPDTSIACCTIADCRAVRARPMAGGWEVLMAGQWMPVPGEKVLNRQNPTGHAVLCYSATLGIQCFVPGPIES